MTETAQAPVPLRLQPTGRTDSVDEWRSPLPPSLWQRADEKRRAEHERLVARFEEARAEVVELVGQVEAQKLADEAALRKALAAGRRPPGEKAVDLAAKLAASRRRLETTATMLRESGRSLVADLSDADLEAAMEDAEREARLLVEGLPGVAAEIRAVIRRSGELGFERNWIGRLHERRRQIPFRPSGAPASSRLADAAQAAIRLEESIQAEVSEREWRDAGPPQHRPPGGYAPPAGTMLTTTRELPVMTDAEGAPIERKPKPAA
jgi:hypothetical protein